MRDWQVQTAKAKFSEFLDACLEEGPQCVTRRGTPAAVLVPYALWQSLETRDRATVKDLLSSPTARSERLIGVRGKLRVRPASAVD